MGLRDQPILILDGACGTNLQQMNIPVVAWDKYEGCNEYLNISAPEIVQELHRSFIQAGAMALETNTFGASDVVLAEYDLADRVEEMNHKAVEHARAAIGGLANRYVIGSIGPTTKLPSLKHISVADLGRSLARQAKALVEAGVDGLIIETCQDILQVKTAMIACFETLEAAGSDIPIMVSVTIERQGTMLVGTDIAAVVATLEPFPVFSLGLNCATGPTDMESHIRYLSHNWPARISCIPNQGLPEVVDGQTVYPLQPELYAKYMKNFVEHDGVSIVGGCCGTTPAHIRAMVDALEGVLPKEREVIQ